MTEEDKIGLNIVKDFYRRLESKRWELSGGLNHRMFDTRMKNGFYQTYVKDNDGQYEETEYPVASIIIKGLCVFDVDFEQIYVSTAISKENALKLNLNEFRKFRFDVAPVKMMNTILFNVDDDIEKLKDALSEYKISGFCFTFFFNYDELTRSNVYDFAKLLAKRGFYY